MNQEHMMSTTREAASEMTVSDVMRNEVLAVEAGWSLDQLADFLVNNGISGAPVTAADGELVGVVSLTDIVRQSCMQDRSADRDNTTHDVYLYDLERRMDRDELHELHVQYEETMQVMDIMTPIVFSVSENTSVQDVAETMLRGGIHRVFVTRDDKLIGIVTALDMLQVVRAL
jgi:CBS domain-containing protein